MIIAHNKTRMKAGISSGGKGGKIIFGLGTAFAVVLAILALLKYG